MSEVLPDPLADLNAQQLRLLRLISEGITTSKGLARETGLQPRSIDTYLHAAARKLGSENRIAAAARLAEIEARNSQSPSQLTSRPVVNSRISFIPKLAKLIRWSTTRLPLGGRQHDLGPAGVALATVYVSILGLGGLLLVVLLVLGILRTFRAFINL